MKNTFNLKVLWKICAPPKLLLFLGLTFAIINTVCLLIIPLIIGSMVENLGSELTFNNILPIIVLFLVELISMGLSTYILSVVGQKLVYNIREKLWKKLLDLKLDFYKKNNPSSLVSRVTNDTAVTMNVLSSQLAEMLTSTLAIIGSVAILFYLDIIMTLIILAVIPVIVLLVLPATKILERISFKKQDITSNFTGYISQTLNEIQLVKSSNNQQAEYNKGKNLISNLYQVGIKKAKVEAVLYPLMGTAISILIISIILIGVYRVSMGYISTGNLVAFLIYLFQIIAPLNTLTRFISSIRTALGATNRINSILNEEDELNSSFLKPLIEPKVNSLEVKDLSFKYDDNNHVLHNINFEAEVNESVAIVGPSGAGKTTLFYLLERFYDKTKGEILIDNLNSSNIDLKNWREMFSYVSQDTAILPGTIRENILYGVDSYSEEDFNRAVELSQCKEFIEELPNKFDTLIGERGFNLSGGQKQRLSIARAFLKDSPILLLDEIASNLDTDTEQKIQLSLQDLMSNKITLFITHKMSTAKNANKIIVLSNGEISRIGTHSELIDKNNIYKKLFDKQSIV